MDYTTLIDDDVAAFIRRTEAFARDAGSSIEDQRRHFNAVCADFARPHPPAISCEDKMMNGVPTRRYLPANAQDTRIAYFHGGGFVVGNLDSHDSICADLAAATGMELISVDYRLAPEHRHPAALEDSLAVRDALLAEAPDRPLLLLGDSAGGWLAAMVAAENPSCIAGQVLIYPMTGASMEAESYIVHGQAPLLSSEAIAWYWAQYFGAAPQETIAPLAYDDLSGQPPTRIIAAGLDPLLDDSRLYAEKLRNAGVDVACDIAEGLPHGFLRARHMTAAGAAAWQRIIAACCTLATP